VPHTDFKRSHAQTVAVAVRDRERPAVPSKSASPSVACLDELPSTAPLSTLRTRMANERARCLLIYAVQTWRQLAAVAEPARDCGRILTGNRFAQSV
jgi:hypothetical protein